MRFAFCQIMHHFNPWIHPSDITLLDITMHRPCYCLELLTQVDTTQDIRSFHPGHVYDT